MMFALPEGWRHVKVTDRHTALDYAQVLKELSDTHFPGSAKIVLVQDNLNTHKPASLYEAFPPPKPAGSSNGSSGTSHQNTAVGWTWQNQNSVFSPPMPRPPHPDQQMLKEEVEAWEADRNRKHAKADWQFTTADARVKLKRLYPAL